MSLMATVLCKSLSKLLCVRQSPSTVLSLIVICYVSFQSLCTDVFPLAP